MFYVSGNKVYLAIKDDKLGVYREVKVHTDADGVVTIVAQSTGVPTKPANRSVCSYEEIVAQFGGATPIEVDLNTPVATKK